ncbi:MBL fold metallo-hydrolase [Piscinibacter sakaiensis]|uniref:MBL fold metallo-hydrolase n=1 Tax=Piscinibacter sakaiensis TaxID=1547922 RepID=UPI003AAACC9C
MGAAEDGPAALRGLTVLERGWLSSNNVVLHPSDEDAGFTLVDSGHCLHAAQTLALLDKVLAGRPLAAVVNTHLHSDHCGGNAALQRAHRVAVTVPAASWRAVQDWDDGQLGYAEVGQRIEAFTAQHGIDNGDRLPLGDRVWEVIAAPGHDPDAVMLFDAAHGVLISGDALWQSGFGVVFPELEGEPAFDDVAAVLDRIAALPVQWVIPGHGAPFDDVDAALSRARSRLAAFRAEPARHVRHAVKVLIKYHLLEEQRQPVEDFVAWAEATPLLRRMWIDQQRPDGSVAAWSLRVLGELVDGGVAGLADGIASNR